MTERTFIAELSGERLDKFLTDHAPELSRSYVKKLVEDGRAVVNGKAGKAGQKLSMGDLVTLDVPIAVETELQAEVMPLNIVYEDADLLVIDKPAGLVVHPAPGHATGTLVNALMNYSKDLAGIAGEIRPGIVHRLDKDTSGLLVVAKNDAAHRYLSEQIKARSANKEYLALVEGHLTHSEGIIEAPVGRSSRDRKKMAITAKGREAITRYKVEEYVGAFTLVRVYLVTGRTHQIRVHFAAIGHPVVGDPVYGKTSNLIGRQFLHAAVLGIRIPSTSEYMEFNAVLSPDLRDALEELRKK